MCLNAAQDKPIFVCPKQTQMTLIQSLEEIRTYGREWAALPTKAARAIPAEDIMHLFVAANKFVRSCCNIMPGCTVSQTIRELRWVGCAEPQGGVTTEQTL